MYCYIYMFMFLWQTEFFETPTYVYIYNIYVIYRYMLIYMMLISLQQIVRKHNPNFETPHGTYSVELKCRDICNVSEDVMTGTYLHKCISTYCLFVYQFMVMFVRIFVVYLEMLWHVYIHVCMVTISLFINICMCMNMYICRDIRDVFWNGEQIICVNICTYT